LALEKIFKKIGKEEHEATADAFFVAAIFSHIITSLLV